MLLIDGSQGEGGGQILRSSLALSLLTNTPIQIHKIRANRTPKPGLQAQHLTSVRAAAEIGQARVDGDRLGSSSLFFSPGEIVGGNYRFPIKTAGATSLVLHTVYLPLALGAKTPSQINIEGGTHVIKAPCYDFLEQSWNAYLKRLGFPLDLNLNRHGFYPRGGGEIQATFPPVERVNSLQLTEAVKHSRAIVTGVVAGLDRDIAKRLVRKATVMLNDLDLEVESSIVEHPHGPGAFVLISLPDGPIPTLFCGLGERGRPAEAVAEEAVRELKTHLKTDAAVDPHSADQLLLPLAFADRESEFRVSEVTLHLLTNARIIEQFQQATIEIVGAEGEPGLVKVKPIRV